ncbi:MAG: hypothetical protein PHV36_03170 [Elusimicrobiales bacterium]|nr:hypothetical protein [Elusimicrobiales bacterium]
MKDLKNSRARGIIIKVLLYVAAIFVCFFALALGRFYLSVRAMELPPESAGDYIRLEPGDKVLHAYTGVRWLDSQRYFLVQADPATFDARILKLSAPAPEVTVDVSTGPGKDLWYGSEPVPPWWDVASLKHVVAVDIGSPRHNHSGSRSFFDKERGLIYVIDR